MGIDYREDARWKVYVHIVPKDVSGYEIDKYYVGITSRDVKLRWGNGSGYKKNDHFYRAIIKYGWNNIEHEIIAENLTKDEACEMEKALIRELKSNDYHYGYNITSGGEGCTGLIGDKNPNYGKRWTEEQRKRMSDYLKEHPRPHTEESRKKISNFNKRRWKDPEYRKSMTGENAPAFGRTGENHPMFGLTGALSPLAKAVICLNTSIVYPSTREASELTGANRSKLCMCCRGERNSSGKDENGNPLRWKYYKDYLKENNLTDEEARKSLFFVE